MIQVHTRLPNLAERRTWLRRGARWAILTATAILALGCSKRDLGPWKEEVRLSDGRVIVVERYESFEVTTPIGDPGSAFVQSAHIKVIAPADLAGVPELVMRYRPIIYDYDAVNNVWFAIGVNDNACDAPPAHMDPNGRLNNHPNFEFRLEGGEWRGVEIGPERLGLPANLLIQRKSIDQFEVFPLAEKSRLNSNEGLPREYRRVESYISC
jgi:hypothetical protein